MLITEIENLMLTITLAKAEIVNPAILDHADLESMFDKQLTGTTIANLLDILKIKVLQSSNKIHFIIEYPRVKFICKKVTIFPVVHNRRILQLADNIVAECGGQVWPVFNCTKTTTTTFCKRAANQTCASGLHSGGTAYCQTQPSYLEAVTIVDDGVIIINHPATVRCDDNLAVNVSRTQLVTFDNFAMVNDTSFRNRNNAQRRLPEVASVPQLNITGYDTILSLPFLHQLSVDNLRTINEVRDNARNDFSPIIAFGLGLSVCTIVCGLILLKHHLQKKRNDFRVNQLMDNTKIKFSKT